jgi:hypothetical protein
MPYLQPKNMKFFVFGLCLLFILSMIVDIIIINISSCNVVSKKRKHSVIGCLDKNGNARWIDALSKATGGKTINPDPNTNGYKKFCKNPSNSKWVKALSKANDNIVVATDPKLNGYTDFKTSCAPCKVGV